MPDSPELTRYLEALLGQQLRRIRGRFLLHGVGAVLFMTGGVLVAYYGLDRLLLLPPVVRVLISLGLVGYVLYLTRRWLLYPLSRSFTRGEPLWLSAPAELVHLFDAQTGLRIGHP